MNALSVREFIGFLELILLLPDGRSHVRTPQVRAGLPDSLLTFSANAQKQSVMLRLRNLGVRDSNPSRAAIFTRMHSFVYRHLVRFIWLVRLSFV